MQEQDGSENTNNADSSDQPQVPQLLAIELRVLGVLMEKQLTKQSYHRLQSKVES